VKAALAAVLYLAAVSLPCPPATEPASRASAAAFSAGALHATHGAPSPDGETARDLRAPCPCPCRHGAPGSVANERLGPALLRAAPALASPSSTTPVALRAPVLADAPPATPDPVPRPA
jgi:hypothetical protein